MNEVKSKDDKKILAQRIGDKINKLRKENDLTLKELSKITGLSVALISRIENGHVMPSITTLLEISTKLNLDIGELFNTEKEQKYTISRQGERKIADNKRGNQVEYLTENLDGRFMEPVIVEYKRPEEKERVETYTHGGQEFLYVLEGKIELILEKKNVQLKKGDTVYWEGGLAHNIVSISKKTARVLNVHFTPGKRVRGGNNDFN